MDSNTMFIIVAVAVAIVIAVLSGVMMCCVVHCVKRHNSRRRRGKVIEVELLPMGPCLTTLLMEDEEQVAKRAFQNSGNVLWTNEGKVFLTNNHVEEMFISSNAQPGAIKSIYIKNSPCSACSAKLITHFSDCQLKPTIFIGKISHLRDPNHKKGIQQLLKNGFEIQVWQTLHDMMFSTKMTEKYIQGLKK